MANKYINLCSTLLVIKEVRIKVSVIHHYTPIGRQVLKGDNTTDEAKHWTCHTFLMEM